ncbi:MAG: HD domain-containing phosphohydrolase, partial [Planctomycetota bacterium]
VFRSRLTLGTSWLATLAQGVGMQMKLPPKELRELGQVALIHDWSLFELPANERFPHQTKSEAAKAAYRRHPEISSQWLSQIPNLSSSAAQICSQVHERLDGSGFPNRIRNEAMHPSARILSVVDTYLTLTSPPTGHARVVPADAIAYLVYGMSAGKFAPTAVSGLLETISLYPLGSVVELSDTSQVRPIHTNGADYGYPTVQDTKDASRRVDLKGSDLFVTRPIVSPEFGETRLNEGAG